MPSDQWVGQSFRGLPRTISKAIVAV